MKTTRIIAITFFTLAVSFTACKKDNNNNNGGPSGNNAADTIAATKLLAYFKFNGDATDKKGHTATASDVTYTTDRFGTANAAYHGSTSAYIKVSPATDLKVGSISISVWLRSQPVTSLTNFILSFIDPSMDWNAGYGIWLEPSTRGDTLRFKSFTMHQNASVYTWLDTQYGVTSKTKFPSSKWFQVAYTYDASKSIRAFYMNGTKVLQDTSRYTPTGSTTLTPVGAITVPSTAQDFYIGKNPNTAQTWIGNYTGDLDDLRLYSVPLTDAQVMALYNSENTQEGQ